MLGLLLTCRRGRLLCLLRQARFGLGDLTLGGGQRLLRALQQLLCAGVLLLGGGELSGLLLGLRGQGAQAGLLLRGPSSHILQLLHVLGDGARVICRGLFRRLDSLLPTTPSLGELLHPRRSSDERRVQLVDGFGLSAQLSGTLGRRRLSAG